MTVATATVNDSLGRSPSSLDANGRVHRRPADRTFADCRLTAPESFLNTGHPAAIPLVVALVLDNSKMCFHPDPPLTKDRSCWLPGITYYREEYEDFARHTCKRIMIQ